MKVLVIGSKGNMGRRYMAILKHLGIECEGFDTDVSVHIGGESYKLKWMLPDTTYDRAIIACPTEHHLEYCTRLEVPMLCEKPISTNSEAIKQLSGDISMVNNWAFLLPKVLKPESCSIVYNFYNTGNEGKWDLIQPLYLSNGNFEIKRDSPVFRLTINSYMINMEMVQASYVKMVENWLEDKNMWNLSMAYDAHKKVERYNGKKI